MGKSRSPAQYLAGMWSQVKSLPTKLGHFARVLSQDWVPLGADASSSIRGDDLLPIDPKEVATYLLDKSAAIADGVNGMINAVNYLALCGGHAPVPEKLNARPLAQVQERVVDNCCALLEHLEESGEKVACFDEAMAPLATARFGYDGEPIVVMEDIDAELVVEAWPAVGEAAVQEAVDFVPPELKASLLDPRACLLLLHEWPDRTPVSKVRASDEEWEKVVSAAYARGLMAPVAPSEVFVDAKGSPVLNGAGSVQKIKKVDGRAKKVQRFISNLVPSNAFQKRLDGDDILLPYLGQITLLEQGEDEVWALDSEDFTSCFNLFKLPPVWRRYMAFGKLVSAKAFNGPADEMVYPSMCVLPMGWISSVAVVQSVVRTLVFKEAEIPVESEVAKTREIPDSGDLTVIYLDSYDQLRRMDKRCQEVLSGTPSERHQRFLDVCKAKGLPLNEGKRLVTATRGALQGGELDGRKGPYGLAPDKMASILALGGGLLGSDEWTEWMLRHFVGKATFGMCFRRPLFSVFQGVFDEIQSLMQSQSRERPLTSLVDEVLLVTALVPFMVTNLKARLDDEISVSDASPSGGGATVARAFRRAPLTVEHDGHRCLECGTVIDPEERYPCPAECGATFCNLACVLQHRDNDHEQSRECPRRAWKPPKFGERFSGPRAPLSHAVAMRGHVEVQPPYDLHFGQDFFSEQGRQELKTLMEPEELVAEHWAPECKLFSRARGKPITLESGRRIAGPQPVRDQHHLMGFPWLSNEMKSKVKRSNNMVLKALRRGADQQRPNKYLTVEHPYRSWMWYFTLMKELELTERERHYKSELELTTERLKDATVAPAVAAILAREEAAMVQGQERDHLRSLLRSTEALIYGILPWWTMVRSPPCMRYRTWRWRGIGRPFWLSPGVKKGISTSWS